MKYLFLVWCIIIKYSIAQEICNNCIDDDGDGLIDCYDPECKNDTAFCSNFYLGVLDSSELSVCNDHFELIEMWSVPGNYSLTDLLVGDIDGDNVPDVLAKNYTSTTTLYIFDGATGLLKNSLPDSSSYHCIGDVDKDGYSEIFGLKHTPARIVRYEHTLGTPTWTAFPPSSIGDHLSLADFDGNDTAELYVNGYIYNSITGMLLVDGSSQMSMTYPQTVAADVLPDIACQYCDGLELINGGNVFAIDLKGGALTLVKSVQMGPVKGRISVADFDSDGFLDVIVNAFDTIYVYNPRTGNLIGNPFTYPQFVSGLEVLLIGNLDNDPGLEIGSIDDRYFVIDDDMTLKWENTEVLDASSGYVPSLMFDFNCDGMQEIVVRGDDGAMHIMRGSDGQILASSLPCNSLTAREHPIIADINNDGHADIICGCADGLKVYTGAAPNNWAASRKVWNQYNYFNVNINDDLTVPCKQQNHGDKNIPSQLNSFFTQAPLFDQNGQACQKNSVFVDALMRIDTMIYLNCDSVNILYSICNISTDSTINLGMYYSIYLDSASQRIKVLTDAVPVSLSPGQCWSSGIIIQATNTEMYFYANDNGFDPDYPPSFTFSECDLSNNTDHIFLEQLSPPLIELEDNFSLCFGDTIILGLYEVNYLWSNGSTESFITIKEMGIYGIRVSLSETDNCYTKDSITINFDNCIQSFFIPNTFSPNGDGVNDFLYIQTISLKVLKFQLFDRMGNLVFETNNLKDRWDGVTQNGKIKAGVFIYYTVMEDLSGNPIIQRGNISVTK